MQRTQIAWAESQSLPGGPRSASLENEPDSGVGDGTFKGQPRTRKEEEAVLLLSPSQVRRVKSWQCKCCTEGSTADGARVRAMQ